MHQIAQLFSPPVLAALRYLFVALAPLAALFGFAGLTPQKIDAIIEIAKQAGVLVGAITAFAGIVGPIVLGAIGTFKATGKEQIKTVGTIASDPSQPLAQDAKQVLIAATIAQPEVRTIVADPVTATASPSSDVVSSDQVKVIENVSGQEISK